MCLILLVGQVPEGKSTDAKRFSELIGSVRIIAIMLFRLGMTVDEAITSYASLSKYIFAKKTLLSSQKKTNASRLEDAIAKVIHSTLNIDESQAQKILMLDDKGSKW